MLATALARSQHALRNIRRSVTSMTRGGSLAIPVTTPRKRKAAFEATAMPILTDAYESADLGQTPSTPAKDSLSRRSHPAAVLKALVDDKDVILAPDPAMSPTATFLSDPLASQEGSALPSTVAATAAAAACDSNLYSWNHNPAAADAAAVAGIHLPDADPKKRAQRKAAAPRRVSKAALAAAAAAAAAEMPTLPALTPDTMPSALAHLMAADPGTCSPTPLHDLASIDPSHVSYHTGTVRVTKCTSCRAVNAISTQNNRNGGTVVSPLAPSYNPTVLTKIQGHHSEPSATCATCVGIEVSAGRACNCCTLCEEYKWQNSSLAHTLLPEILNLWWRHPRVFSMQRAHGWLCFATSTRV